MNMMSIIDLYTAKFKQMILEICAETGDAPTAELGPEAYMKVVGALKSAAADAGIKAVVEYVQSCDSGGYSVKAGGKLACFKELVPKEFHVGFGMATIMRRVYRHADGGGDVVPLDIMFNVVDEYFFPDIRGAILHCVASKPPEDLVADMARFALRPPSVTAVRRLTHETGVKLESGREELEAATSLSARMPREAVHAMVVSMDGASVPVRQEERGHKYERHYKMAMCGTVGLYGEAVPDKDGVLRMERVASMGFARMPEEKCPTFKRALDAEASRVAAAAPSGTPMILLMDGAIHQWAHVEGNPVYGGYLHLVDFYHAGEHLHAAAEALFGMGMAAGRKWEEKWKGELLAEERQALGLCRSIEYYLKAKRLTKANRAEAERQLTYFRNNSARMNYAWFRKRGLPIGSGPVESCCKLLVKSRLCGSGMSWSGEGGQAVLTLRAHRKAGDWDMMWSAYLRIRQKANPTLEMAA